MTVVSCNDTCAWVLMIIPEGATGSPGNIRTEPAVAVIIEPAPVTVRVRNGQDDSWSRYVVIVACSSVSFPPAETVM